MKRPNFFILGAPKCGTTALAHYLGEHPRVFMSRPKEPHFFNTDHSPRYRLTLDTYLDLFQEASPGTHLAVGEASTGYLFSHTAVPGILKFDPQARFIVMLRDPLDLVRSLHSHNLWIGTEDIQDLEEAWRAQEDRKAGRRIPPLAKDPATLQYSQWGFLGEALERLFTWTSRERVLVLFLEDMTKDPKKVYERTLDFLGVPSDGRAHFPKVNESKRVRWPFLQQAIRFLSNPMRRPRAPGRRSRFFGLSGWLRGMNSRPSPKPPLRAEFLEELREFYRPDVVKLSGLLGRDLSHWLK